MLYNSNLSIIQRCYDLIAWFIPRLEKLPRSHKYTLGDRIQNGLYDLLEALIRARYTPNEVAAPALILRLHLPRCGRRRGVLFRYSCAVGSRRRRRRRNGRSASGTFHPAGGECVCGTETLSGLYEVFLQEASL